VRTAAIFGVALLASLAFGPQAKPQTGGGDPAIRKIADEYAKATLAGDAKAIAALYAEDAVEMPPNQASIKGRAAIADYYGKLMSGAKFASFTLTHVESHASGDSAYDIGTYKETLTPAGATAPISDTGKYVVILKRTGGAWKVAYAIYNSDQPLPTSR